MAKAMGPQLGVLCGSERPDPKLMWGWDPQRPKGWTPVSLCIGVPNGQSNGTPTWGALWFRKAGPQNHVGWGTPTTKGVDSKLSVHWDPQWPKQWDPKLGCSVVPKIRPQNDVGLGTPKTKGMDPKVMGCGGPQWPKQWEPDLGCFVVSKGWTQTHVGLGSP